jgi:hypothetical protein
MVIVNVAYFRATTGDAFDALHSVIVNPRLFPGVHIFSVLSQDMQPSYTVDSHGGANILTSRMTTTSTCLNGAATPGMVLAGLLAKHSELAMQCVLNDVHDGCE